MVVAALDDAPGLVNRIAPEHVEFAVDEPERLANRVRHAGAIFLGRYAPEALGDYVAGSNHVLPTSRAARFSSGLSVYDFLKRTSIIGCDAAAFQVLAGPTELLANAEGLPAHARSASIRRNRPRLRGVDAVAERRVTAHGEHRLQSVVLDEESLSAASRDQEQERQIAIFDLLEDNHFAPEGAEGGPYRPDASR